MSLWPMLKQFFQEPSSHQLVFWSDKMHNPGEQSGSFHDGSEFFWCGSWFKMVFHSPSLQICFQEANQSFPMGMITFDITFDSFWWQSMFQHQVSKGPNDSIFQFHSFEPTSDSLFQHAAWHCEIWRNKPECSINQPFVLNLSIISTIPKA